MSIANKRAIFIPRRDFYELETGFARSGKFISISLTIKIVISLQINMYGLTCATAEQCEGKRGIERCIDIEISWDELARI